MTRRGWAILAKLAISAALLAWLFRAHLSPGEIRAALAAPRWPALLGALGIYALSAVAGAVQWTWILRVAGVTAPSAELHRLYNVGLFFNNFLPANVGGDAVKIFDLGRQEGRRLKIFCATLLDRLVGLSSLTLLALLAVGAAALRLAALPPVFPLLLAMLVWFAVLTLLLSRRVSTRLPPLLRRLRWEAGAARVEQVVAEFALYRPRVGWFARVFAFSLGVQALRVATHLAAATGLGIALSGEQALQLFVLVPLLGIVVALPVSVNGIGLRESFTVLMFTTAGIAAADAVAMELVAFLVQVAFSLVGGVLFLSGRRRARAAAAGGNGVPPPPAGGNSRRSGVVGS